MTTTRLAVDPSTIVDEITNSYPGTFEVFSRFGIDICCGGGVTLAEAAARDGADLEGLRRALREEISASRPASR